MEQKEFFIVYTGDDISSEDLEIHLEKWVHNTDYFVKRVEADKSCMVAISDNNADEEEIQPHEYGDMICVADCEYENFNEFFSNWDDRFDIITGNDIIYRQNFINLYDVYRENLFEKLLKNNNSYSLVLNDDNGSIIASRGKNHSDIGKLYYGFSKSNNIMFSNEIECLREYCKDIQEFPCEAYYKDGQFYDLTVEKQLAGKPFQPMKIDDMAVKSFIAGLNNVLYDGITNNIGEKLEKLIDDYLETFKSDKLADKKIVSAMIKSIKESILSETKQEIEKIADSKASIISDAKASLEEIKHQLVEKATTQFQEKMNLITEDYMKKTPIPRVNIIKLPNGSENQVSGIFHEKFEDILTVASLNEPIMLVGPAGSGKNVACSQVAKALGLQMYYTNNANNEFKITGFVDAGGNYRERPFYKAFKNGGLFFLDEIDNSDPSALIVMNSAIANGYMDFPHETVEAHKDFRMIAAANTWGKGSDLHYVGRTALDAATLDRFDTIFFDYDRNMEQSLYPNKDLLQYMWSFRDSVLSSRILHIISTRGIAKAYKKLINDVPIDLILSTTVLKGLSEDDINIILGKMNNISDKNEFMYETKVLNKVLKRNPQKNNDSSDNGN